MRFLHFATLDGHGKLTHYDQLLGRIDSLAQGAIGQSDAGRLSMLALVFKDPFSSQQVMTPSQTHLCVKIEPRSVRVFWYTCARHRYRCGVAPCVASEHVGVRLF